MRKTHAPGTRPLPRMLRILGCLAVLALAPVLRMEAQPLYPSGETFDCDFVRANGTSGKSTVKFSLSGSLAQQQGTLSTQILNGTSFSNAVELGSPTWEGSVKVWQYRQTDNSVTCKLSVWSNGLLWDNCSNGNRQTCKKAGTSSAQAIGSTFAYLQIKGLWLETDHEGWWRGGDPEIEIYPLEHEPCQTALWCYKPPSTTTLIFDGRTITDAIGQRVVLPDVNKTRTWINFAPVHIPFEYGMGLQLLEDDKDRGKAYFSDSSPWEIGITCKPGDLSDPVYKASIPIDIGPCENPRFSGKALLALLGAGDDPYKDAIAVTHVVERGQDFILETSEWKVKVSVIY